MSTIESQVNSTAANKRLLFTVNDVYFLISHRLGLVHTAIARGYKVAVAAPNLDAASKARIGDAEFFTFPLHRWGGNPVRELASLFALRRIMAEFKPDILHNVTIKPVIYGTIAASKWPRMLVVNSIPGLGHAFAPENMLQRARLAIVRQLYRFAYRHPNVETIFQNDSDRAAFEALHLPHKLRPHVILGSGVDLEAFSPAPEPAGRIIIGFVGRLLLDKGVYDFCEVAKRMHAKRTDIAFRIVGSAVPGHPRSVDPGELSNRCREANIRWDGASNDIPTVMREIHILCVPTSYNEGLPKVMLEASATCRPVVATSLPGCLQFVRDGENGLIFPPGNVDALEKALNRLIDEPGLRQALGRRGREILETQGLGLQDIVNRTLDVYHGGSAL